MQRRISTIYPTVPPNGSGEHAEANAGFFFTMERTMTPNTLYGEWITHRVSITGASHCEDVTNWMKLVKVTHVVQYLCKDNGVS
eukprot:2463620-Amphidinium_carterae.1